MGASNYVDLHVVEILKESESGLAFLLDLGRDRDIEWWPKSQIADADNYKAGEKDLDISITEFIAKQRGIDCE